MGVFHAKGWGSKLVLLGFEGQTEPGMSRKVLLGYPGPLKGVQKVCTIRKLEKGALEKGYLHTIIQN